MAARQAEFLLLQSDRTLCAFRSSWLRAHMPFLAWDLHADFGEQIFGGSSANSLHLAFCLIWLYRSGAGCAGGIVGESSCLLRGDAAICAASEG
eukprot:5425240-Prymnesium_polylepis.1